MIVYFNIVVFPYWNIQLQKIHNTYYLLSITCLLLVYYFVVYYFVFQELIPALFYTFK